MSILFIINYSPIKENNKKTKHWTNNSNKEFIFCGIVAIFKNCHVDVNCRLINLLLDKTKLANIEKTVIGIYNNSTYQHLCSITVFKNCAVDVDCCLIHVRLDQSCKDHETIIENYYNTSSYQNF